MVSKEYLQGQLDALKGIDGQEQECERLDALIESLEVTEPESAKPTSEASKPQGLEEAAEKFAATLGSEEADPGDSYTCNVFSAAVQGFHAGDAAGYARAKAEVAESVGKLRGVVEEAIQLCEAGCVDYKHEDGDFRDKLDDALPLLESLEVK